MSAMRKLERSKRRKLGRVMTEQPWKENNLLFISYLIFAKLINRNYFVGNYYICANDHFLKY